MYEVFHRKKMLGWVKEPPVMLAISFEVICIFILFVTNHMSYQFFFRSNSGTNGGVWASEQPCPLWPIGARSPPRDGASKVGPISEWIGRCPYNLFTWFAEFKFGNKTRSTARRKPAMGFIPQGSGMEPRWTFPVWRQDCQTSNSQSRK